MSGGRRLAPPAADAGPGAAPDAGSDCWVCPYCGAAAERDDAGSCEFGSVEEWSEHMESEHGVRGPL